MNFGWLHDKPEAPPATWEDFAYFYRSKFYHITVSDRDHVEKTQFYYNEAFINENEGLNGCDFLPLNFKTAFSILTHQVTKAPQHSCNAPVLRRKSKVCKIVLRSSCWTADRAGHVEL
uniref:Uncharacterized protein n=1 Tax=Glossina austeni TaxID=7395 RepID=A0A1A9V6D3_GLOAU